MLILSAFWLQGLLIVIVPQPLFSQSDVNRHDNKFCLIVTVFLGKPSAFISTLSSTEKPAKVDPECSSLAEKLLGGKIDFDLLAG